MLPKTEKKLSGQRRIDLSILKIKEMVKEKPGVTVSVVAAELHVGGLGISRELAFRIIHDMLETGRVFGWVRQLCSDEARFNLFTSTKEPDARPTIDGVRNRYDGEHFGEETLYPNRQDCEDRIAKFISRLETEKAEKEKAAKLKAEEDSRKMWQSMAEWERGQEEARQERERERQARMVRC